MEKRDNRPQEQEKAPWPNEGEGSRSAARDYNQRTRAFVESGKVEGRAEAARKAVEGPECKELEQAETEGRARAKGEDPAVARPRAPGSRHAGGR